MNRRKFLTAGISTIALTQMAKAIETKGLQTQNAKLIGGASKIADRDSSQGYLVSLTQAGHGVRFAGLPAGDRLAIRYSSLSVGTISVAVNDKPACKVNIHSSGALTSSYLDAIVDLAIPANATVTISLAPNDVGVNIDRIVVGDELGLPPDIWNLPAVTGCQRSIFRRLEGPRPNLYRSGVVARCQVWRMVALGSAIHA